MKDIESLLGQHPGPQLPPEWRGDILSAAKSARETLEKTRTPVWRNGLSWGALAAVWVLIFTLHFSTKPSKPSPEFVQMNPAVLREHCRQQRQMVAELLNQQPLPPPVEAESVLPKQQPNPDPRSSDSQSAALFSPLV